MRLTCLLCMGCHQAKQPMPGKVGIASFDPRFEGRQHAFRPQRVFHPPPAVADVSGLLRRRVRRHCRRFGFARCVFHASTFLRPFARRALPRFLAPMDALTPAPTALRPRASSMNTAGAAQVSLLPPLGLPTIPSPTVQCRGRGSAPLRSVTSRRAATWPLGLSPVPTSRVTRRLVPRHRPNRVRCVSPCGDALRTGRSRFVALHLMSP
jgi:hypothetical protein